MEGVGIVGHVVQALVEHLWVYGLILFQQIQLRLQQAEQRADIAVLCIERGQNRMTAELVAPQVADDRVPVSATVSA